MIDCPIFYVDPNSSTCGSSPLVDDTVTCNGCNCGYLQYEDLIPYLSEIKDKVHEDPDDYNQLEFRFREQILQVSRLFDYEAGVRPGYFSKAHYSTTQIYTTNGGKYIKIPEFVLGTLEVRTLDNNLINESNYGFENQHLIYKPCSIHTTCGCPNTCSRKRIKRPIAWPHHCYKVSARWGKECTDQAVKMAVRDYLIETYRLQDLIKVMATGLPFQASFRVPHSWDTYMKNFKQRNKFFSQWAIA